MTPSPRRSAFQQFRESTVAVSTTLGALGVICAVLATGMGKGQRLASLPPRVDSIERSYASRATVDSLKARMDGFEHGQRAALAQLDAIYRRQLYGDCVRGDTLPDVCARAHLLGQPGEVRE